MGETGLSRIAAGLANGPPAANHGLAVPSQGAKRKEGANAALAKSEGKVPKEDPGQAEVLTTCRRQNRAQSGLDPGDAGSIGQSGGLRKV